MPAKVPPFERLMIGCKKDPETLCWVWQGHTYKNGYGCLKAFGKTVSAHRLSYELYKGPIPDGREIMHSCDNRLCVNPDHLTTGTHAANMKEAADRGRMPRGKAHHMYGRKNPRPNQANVVLVLGIKYDSQKEAERQLGLGSGTVRYWIKNKPEKARIIKEGKYNAE